MLYLNEVLVDEGFDKARVCVYLNNKRQEIVVHDGAYIQVYVRVIDGLAYRTVGFHQFGSDNQKNKQLRQYVRKLFADYLKDTGDKISVLSHLNFGHSVPTYLTPEISQQMISGTGEGETFTAKNVIGSFVFLKVHGFLVPYYGELTKELEVLAKRDYEYLKQMPGWMIPTWVCLDPVSKRAIRKLIDLGKIARS